MKIWLTGGTGFLGQHLAAELRTRGHEVIATGRSVNLLDEQLVDYTLRFHKPDAVIHAAARVGGIGANMAAPADFITDNLRMGMNVIEASFRRKVSKFVLIGTACMYPKLMPVPFNEIGVWGGYPEETNAPYGIAKRALMEMTQAYHKQHGWNAITVIPANLYGPGDHYGDGAHVIPDLIRKFVQAVAEDAPTVTLWGDGTATRDFLFVEDAARGIADALEKYDSTTPVNLGSGMDLSIHTLASQIAYLCEYDGAVKWDASMPNGQPRRRLDITRARERMGWSPRVSFREGLKRTVEAYMQQQKVVAHG